MKRVIQYLKDVRVEVAKVNWPNKDEITGATILVVCLSIVMALFTFACDQVLQNAMKLLMGTR